MPSRDRDEELVLERYRLVRRLGSGGFGVVWLAHDVRLDRAVAVKRIPVDGDGVPDGAPREAQAAARLSHPGIVALYEAGQDEDACWLVSELVRGETLGSLLAQGALSDRDVLGIGAALCDALAHAHARGVIHRDVKPGNVMVPERQEGGGSMAKLTDFGIARIVGGEALTRTGDVVGTLAYMAPEQAEGRRITPAVDVYALALVLFEALSGVNPVRGNGPADTARRVGEPLPELRRLRRDLPLDLCEAIDAAVEIDPEHRSTLGELREALVAWEAEVGDEPGTVEGSLLDEATRRFTLRRPRPEEPGWAPSVASLRASRGQATLSDPEPPSVDPLRASRGQATLSERMVLGSEWVPLPKRIYAGLGAGGLTLAAATYLPAAPPPVAPLTLAAIAALATALLPRLGWFLAAATAIAWTALAHDGSTDTALLLVAAVAPIPALLLLSPAAWSTPALAPLLGYAGLAAAYPVLAGQARTLWRRAVLGAAGALWIGLLETYTHHTLLGGAPSGHALRDLHATGALAVAPVWALAAATLPLLVRGRSALADAVAGGTWSAGLAVATGAALQAADAPHARGLAAAAALSTALAMAAAALRTGRAHVDVT